MIPTRFDDFHEIWLVDFEFRCPDGETPTVVCMVARELRSGRLQRRWWDTLRNIKRPPFPVDSGALYVAYYASAEMLCHLSYDWPMPVYVLDLFTEFRCLTNGRPLPSGRGLIGALRYHGIDTIAVEEKTEMRELAMREGPHTGLERMDLLNYCQADVDALAKLLAAMSDRIDLPRALHRGRYMKAVARMEYNGVPIDTEILKALRDNWWNIKTDLIAEIDRDFGVYDGTTFKSDLFAEYLTKHNIPWPRTETGRLSLSDDTFRDGVKRHPQLAPLKELRVSLGQLRLNSLSVGEDGRNRCMLSAFRSITGRNQPSNAKFIYGPSAWIRSLIKPESGRAIAYVDYSQQEFGIAAALSGDANMMAAYRSGDPYLAFAKQAGAVPDNATKQTHPNERSRFKVCALAVQYGMGPKSLAESMNEPKIEGRELLRLHQETYPKFWAWSQAAMDHGELKGSLQTVLGWRVGVGEESNPRSLANFPCQANGAEMLRLACCLLTEAGIAVCAPVHDAVLVEGPADDIDRIVAETQRIMRQASEIILDGFPIHTDAEIVRYPDRYQDERGARMWATVTRLLGEHSTKPTCYVS